MRLNSPHHLFPFDLLRNTKVLDILRTHTDLPSDVVEELAIVRDHCMTPPFPWGHIIYRDFLLTSVLPDVPGDLAEFGVGLGGTSVFFARFAKSLDRKFLAVDSFVGLPAPNLAQDNHYFIQGDYCPPSPDVDNYEGFLKYKSRYHVDDNLYTVKTFFCDLKIPEEFDQFAFVHIDSDLYESVYDTFVKVWDRVSEGGCVAVDDFFHHAQGPARAVSDFFRNRTEENPPLLYVVPPYAVLILKGRSACLGQSEEGKPRMHSPRALDGNFYSFRLMRSSKPFLSVVELSLQTAIRAREAAEENGESVEPYDYIVENAENLLEFLQRLDTDPRSGLDICRYLQPLADFFDMSRGTICGVHGMERDLIKYRI